MLVRDLSDGQQVDLVLLVRACEVRSRRDGDEYLKVTLADRSGSVCAMVWEDVDTHRELCAPGSPVKVSGRYALHPRYGAQVSVQRICAPAEHEFELDALLDGPPRSAALMEADLRELIATVQDRHLRELLDRLIGPDAPTWPAFRDAAAAKVYHQAYRHGLLEHSLSVGQAVSAAASTFGGVDRDVAVTGALLHDIGKLDAYSHDPCAIEMSDLGRLQGEIPLGYYRVRRLIEDIPGFPEHRSTAVLHIILAHHGQLEYGSPVVPCTREATLVHMMDNLGGRLGSFDRIEKALPEGSRWSGYDRALGGGAFFGSGAVA